MKGLKKQIGKAKVTFQTGVRHGVEVKEPTVSSRPTIEHKDNVKDLVKKITKQNRHEATDWTPVGKEEL
ncbi:hypothetical protein [Nitrospira sp. Nam74]